MRSGEEIIMKDEEGMPLSPGAYSIVVGDMYNLSLEVRVYDR
jgi:hypothetical protein